MLEDMEDLLSVAVQGCTMPVCPSSLYNDVEKPFYPGCNPLQSKESLYPPSIRTLNSQMAPRFSVTTAAPPVSFFEWQIKQEEEKLMGLSHVRLTSRDEDGDT